jgi:hypothetical protein
MNFFRSLLLFAILAMPVMVGLTSCGYRLINRLM